MSFVAGVAALAVVTAVCCALPGVIVVLRRSSMLVDAISHAVLPGIVLGYALTHDLRSPLLMIGAGLAGLLVVLGSEYLARTGLVTGDAPQGLVFPALFSIGVILVSADFAHVHLDVHAVLVGDLNLAAFDHLMVSGVSIGPSYLYVMLGLLVLNAGFLAACWRPLTVSTFDPQFARSLGLRSGVLGVAFMVIVAITVTASFHAAGAVLVLAVMIAPPATARLLVTRLPAMAAATAVIAAAGALAGFGLAYLLDAPTSAGMALCYGVLFAVVLAAVRLRHRRTARRTGPDTARPDTARPDAIVRETRRSGPVDNGVSPARS